MRVIYDLNHCAYKTAGYNCKFVYKTINTTFVRLGVRHSDTSCCLSFWRVDNNRGEQVLNFQKGHNSLFTLIQFMTRIYALNGRKLIIAKTMCHVPSSHSLSTRALHTVDEYAFRCRRCKVMYSLRCGQTAMPFGKTGGTAPGFRRCLHRWSETTSFRFVFVQCCYPYLTSTKLS